MGSGYYLKAWTMEGCIVYNCIRRVYFIQSSDILVLYGVIYNRFAHTKADKSPAGNCVVSILIVSLFAGTPARYAWQFYILDMCFVKTNFLDIRVHVLWSSLDELC